MIVFKDVRAVKLKHENLLAIKMKDAFLEMVINFFCSVKDVQNCFIQIEYAIKLTARVRINNKRLLKVKKCL